VARDLAAGGARPTAAALVFALLALPLDPRWLDFEVARRGLLLAVAAGLVLLVPGLPRRPRGRSAALLAALCAWLVVRAFGTVNPAEGLLTVAYWIALATLFACGTRYAPDELARAALPATAIAALFGLAQAVGLDWPRGTAAEPVATFGNLNVAAEVVTLGAALAAVRILRSEKAWGWPAATLGLAVAYLVANGSLGGLVACALALALALASGAAARAPRTRLLALGVTCAVASGSALLSIAPGPESPAEPPPSAPAAAVHAVEAAPSTLAVRRALWDGTLAMWRDAPLAGHGTGQFRYVYPRYRTQEEIELTTFGRRFPTYAATAHQDPLELAAEIGLVGLGLWIAFLIAAAGRALRRPGEWWLLVPLAAFLAHGMVRSPLSNAPAAAVAFAWLGALAGPGPRPEAPRSLLRGAFALGAALVLALPGFALAAAESAAGAGLARFRRGEAFDALDTAVDLHPSESRFRSLRVIARCGGVEGGVLRRKGPAEYHACDHDLLALARLDPHNTNALFLTAQLAFAAGRREAARAALGAILALDPREPRATLLSAVLLAESGALPAAIATLYADPHPTLRRGLADHLAGLRQVAAVLKDEAQRALLEREVRFVTAVDAVLSGDAAVARPAVFRFVANSGADPRAPVLLAAGYLLNGQLADAERTAPDGGLELPDTARAILEPVLARLAAALPAWRRAVDA